MSRTVGVLVMEHIAVGLVEGNKLAAPPNIYPQQGSSADALLSMPAESIGERIKQQIAEVTRGQKIEAVGLGFPGVIRNGVIRSDDLETRSPAMRLEYRGNVDLEGHLNARVEAELFRDMWAIGPVVSTVLSSLKICTLLMDL